MARGKNAKVGDTRVSDNGYHYTRVETGWVLTHHIVAERKLGRKIQSNETVSFKDRDKTNLDPSNIEVKLKGSGSLTRRKAQIEARIQELQAELVDVEEKIREYAEQKAAEKL